MSGAVARAGKVARLITTLSDTQIDELREKHGDIRVIGTMLGDCVFATPTRPNCKRFSSMLSDDKRKADAVEFLVRSCVVHPSREEFEAMLDEKPGILWTCAPPVQELAGFSSEPEVKK